MSSRDESMTERELAQKLQDELFSGKPRSVGEALAADDPTPLIEDPPGQPGDELEPPPKPPAEPEPVEAPPIVVSDEPGRDIEKGQEPAPVAAEAAPEPEEEEPEEDTEEEEDLPHLAWAKKKYGDDPDKWAKAAFDQEQHISRMANSLKEAEQLAVQWYEYAQQAERQAAQQQQMGMPLSAQEEAWVEQAMTNPYTYARQAGMQGNVPLFNAVLARVAEDNPGLAASIGSQIQMEMQQYVAAQDNGAMQAAPTLDQALGASFQRLGINLEQAGPQMMAKVQELGEYHPYVQAILTGDDAQRDLAVQAVYDLVRAGTLTKRRVSDDQRAEQIKREGELRREAAGVVTGSPHVPPQEKDPFVDAMRQEWKDRRQWGEGE
jgi:hypothetical protein